MVGVLVVVGWTAATLAVQLPPVGDGGTLALPAGQNQVAMWATAAVLTLRRMVPPVALLLAVPLYVVVLSLPLYDLGHPVEAEACSAMPPSSTWCPSSPSRTWSRSRVPSARWWRAPCAWQARGCCSSTSTA